jgi:uncharacterized membrane protein
MSAIRTILFALAAGLVLCALQPAALASGYVPVHTGAVDSGSTITANGCFVRFDLSNGSGSARVTVSSPNYPQQVVTISPDQSYYYYDALRIYVASIDFRASRIMVDISKPAGSGGGDTPSGTKLSCEVPGQLALAGDRVTFPLVIQNNYDEDKTYTLTSSSDTGWSIRFTSGGTGVYKVFVPKQSSKTVSLEVYTTGATGVGEKKVTASVDGQSIDLYVQITSVNQSAEVSAKVSSRIASIGDKIYYEISIRNLQPKENIYKLSATGLPDSWYYRYKENQASVEELAETAIPASGEKSLVLEIVPPYSVSEGDYNFTAVVSAPDGTKIARDLLLRLKSGVSMSMTTARLAYDAKPGEAFSIDVYVRNEGSGAALTNVYLETKAPDGWIVQVTPNQTNSIKAGQSQLFKVRITPPGNIVASDYDVTVKAKSDQAEKEKDYRITIKVDSYVPYVGGAIILLVLGGLVLVYRKFGRR